ncbi:ribbon-helix-helix domain-containing protein [Candidatus Woesearchaeota archaeon]|nr:ribbon-helix-helix domain-containing protein [Candidatus Woesearchaeota archaeon]
MNEMVHLRIDNKLRREIKIMVKNNLFSNESEFIRDSIRKNLEQYQKIKLLEKFQNKLDQKPTKKSNLNIFRQFGIE